MAFIGTPLDTRNTFQSLVGKRFNGDGSTTAFTLDVAPSSVLDIEVFVGNVRQDPNSAYTLSGTTLTFTGAPPSGTNNIYVVHQAKSVGTIGIPDDTISAKTLVTLDSSNDHVLIEDATDGGLKKALVPTFDTDAAVVFNESGAAVDFRVEGDTDTHLLMVDGSSDFVGIGEDVPEGKLHIFTGDASVGPNAQADELVVEGSAHTGISILSGNDDKGNIYFGDSGDDDIGSITYHHDGNSMRFTTNASERIRILDDGDVSIGTTSNEARLDTRYNANASGFQIHNQKSSGCNSSTKVAVIQGDQDSSGSYDLIHGRNGGGHVFNVADSGNVQNTGNSYGSLSDNRIKQNIVDASSQWDDIKALKIKNFKLKKLVNRDGDSAPTHLGVIAQDLETSNMNGLVEEINPTKEDVALNSDFGTVVSGTADNGATPITDEEGKITGYKDIFTEGQKVKTVKYSVLYMKAIKALQEAMTRIETLEAKVKTLEEA